MELLTKQDEALISAARAAICRNYDDVHFRHTVGAAVRCGSGAVYTGVNVYSIHGACAEQVALGAALTAGEREFTDIVAVRGPEGGEILPPCGNCRQLLSDYAPNCRVIVPTPAGPRKVSAKELLPFAYEVE